MSDWTDDITNDNVDMAARNMLSMFNELRKEANISPVHSGPIYVSEAVELCSIGTNSSDVNEMLTLQRNKDSSENDYMNAMMDKVLLLAAILAIPTGIYILVNAL